MYCDTQAEWPFQSQCQEYRALGDVCTSDYQCANHHYCWYESADKRAAEEKTCMEVYYADIGDKFGWYSESETEPVEADYMRNGMHCKTGLAFQSA